MNKIIFCLSSVLLVGSAVAQSNVQRVYQPQTQVSTQVTEERPEVVPAQRVNAIFTETFSNGFDGDGAGAWTTSDNSPSGDEIWKYAPTEGTPPNFTQPVGNLALTSPTSSNGYAWFDAFGFTDQANAFSLVGELISPSLDLSDEPSVILDYYQKFAYCCFSYSPLQVEVSNDGGASWITYPGEGTFLPDANVGSGNLHTVIDITCAAGGQSDVIIKFKWSDHLDAGNIGFPYYSWSIDDVSLCAAASTNDIAISQITNGDVFEIWEYRVTPLQQAPTAADGGMLVGVMYSNVGLEDQENVVFDIDVLDAGGTSIYNYSSSAITIPSSANDALCPNLGDTLYFETGFVPSATGYYTLEVSATGDATDDTPDNNTMQRAIAYTNAEYGHDDDNNLDMEFRPETADSGFETTGYGNFFTVPNEGSEALGVTVRFGPNTDVGIEAQARIYEVESSADINTFAENSGTIVASHIVEAADIVPGTITYIEFDDQLMLQPGFLYFACVNTPGPSPSELTVMGQANSDTDNSSFVVALTGDQVDNWFGDQGTPAVRLVMDNEPSGLADISVLDVEMSIAPNPVNDRALVQFTTQEALNLEFKIYDTQGRIVYQEALGKLVAGQHQLNIDASNFAAGLYNYRLVSGKSQVTKTMIVSK